MLHGPENAALCGNPWRLFRHMRLVSTNECGAIKRGIHFFSIHAWFWGYSCRHLCRELDEKTDTAVTIKAGAGTVGETSKRKTDFERIQPKTPHLFRPPSKAIPPKHIFMFMATLRSLSLSISPCLPHYEITVVMICHYLNKIELKLNWTIVLLQPQIPELFCFFPPDIYRYANTIQTIYP